MPEEQDLEPRNNELIEALGVLQLAPAQTSLRDVWYQAGFESGRRRSNVWRAAAVVAFLACGVLTFARVSKPPASEHTVYVKEQSLPLQSTMSVGLVSPPTHGSSYERLCERVAMLGLNGLPPDKIWSDSSPPSRSDNSDRRSMDSSDWPLPIHGG